jgi:hypothetical protein
MTDTVCLEIPNGVLEDNIKKNRLTGNEMGKTGSGYSL